MKGKLAKQSSNVRSPTYSPISKTDFLKNGPNVNQNDIVATSTKKVKSKKDLIE